MAGETRQTLIHLHTSDNRAPSGSVLTVGEIAVSHPNVQDAALYTKIDNENIAKFITDIEIDARISAATEILDNIIYTREEFSGITESGSLVDALVVKEVIVENEEVTSASLNDLNSKLGSVSGAVVDLAEEITAITLTDYASAITINGVQHDVSNNAVDLGYYLSAATAHVTTIPQTENASAITTTINYVKADGSASAVTITQDLIIDCGTF